MGASCAAPGLTRASREASHVRPQQDPPASDTGCSDGTPLWPRSGFGPVEPRRADGFFTSTAAAALLQPGAAQAAASATFPEVARIRDARDHWPAGYARQVLIRWGDPIMPKAPGFDMSALTGAAADLPGATPMDAPEGVMPSPGTGKIHVAMIENEDRLPTGEGDASAQVNAANPRGPNPHGDLPELVPPTFAASGAPDAPDRAAESYRWGVFILCGNPALPEDGAIMHPATSVDGWFTDPDKMAIDRECRLWVCTDGPPPKGVADPLCVKDTEREGRALPKLFYVAPVGSEVCSPAFTPDGRMVLLSIRHPGELRFEDDEDAESIARAGTLWPDFTPGVPPRPAVAVLTREDGQLVGA